MRLAILLAMLLLPAVAPVAAAQRTFRTIGEDFRNGLSDMIWFWASPLRADGEQWLTAAGVVAASGAVGVYDGEIQDWMARHPSSAAVRMLQPFREEESIPLTDLGSGKRIIPIAGVLYLIGFAADSRDLRDAGIGCAASQQVQTLTHEVALHVVARQRPRESGPAPYEIGADPYVFEYFESTPWGMHSFYGGHGANAMSCATFLSERFHLGIAEPLLYATAVGIAFARVADGRHWTSDTILGLAFGHAIGRSVAGRQKARLARERDETASTEPEGGFYVDGDARGLILGWRHGF